MKLKVDWEEEIRKIIWAFVNLRTKRSIWVWGIRVFTISLLTEIGALFLPESLEPNYADIKDKLGWLPAVALAILVSKILFPGDWQAIVIKLGVIILFSVFELANQWIKHKKWSQLKIDQDWIRTTFQKLYDPSLKEKYIKELHTNTIFESQHVGPLLVTSEYIDVIESRTVKNEEYLGVIKRNVSLLTTFLDQQQFQDANEATEILNEYVLLVESSLVAQRAFIQHARKKAVSQFNYDSIPSVEVCNEKGDLLYNFLITKTQTWIPIINNQGANEARSAYDFLTYEFHTADYVYINSRILTSKERVIHIHGSAGSGKTHLACNLADSYFSANLPFLFVPATRFNNYNQALEQPIKTILGIPAEYTVDNFLDKLNALGNTHNCRVPIIIDGLNETTFENQGLSPIWQTHLNGFAQSIDQRENLVLITTLRTTYLQIVFGNNQGNCYELEGFTDVDDLGALAKTYFDYYKIDAGNLSIQNLSFFQKPIYISFFCERQNPDRKIQKQVVLTAHSFYSLVGEYLSEINNEVCISLGRVPESNQVLDGIYRVANLFWQNNNATITYQQFLETVDQQPIAQILLNQSIAHKLLEYGLLFYRDHTDVEVVRFTYQLVGGYCIAKGIRQTNVNMTTFLSGADCAQKLLSDNYQELHEMAPDILRNLTYNLKIEGIRTFDLHYSDRLFSQYVTSLFEIPSIEITNKDLLIIEDIFHNVQNAPLLLKEAQKLDKIINHRLNWEFWNRVLDDLGKQSIDRFWSKHILENETYYTQITSEFEKLLNTPQIQETQLRLYALICKWILVTNIRGLRDKATQALYLYGCKFHTQLHEMTKGSVHHSDIYIYERLLLATYGVCMEKQNDTQFVQQHLNIICKDYYEIQFSETSLSATSHFIVIDTIKHLIDLAVHKGACTLSAPELDRVSNYQFNVPFDFRLPPFSERKALIRSANNGYIVSHPSPYAMDFIIYTINRLFDSGDDDKPKEHARAVAKIYSRIIELGWDEKILNQKPFFESRSELSDCKIDRMGKKYCWIAYFEYAGYLLSKGQLKIRSEDGEDNYYRLSDIEIDPSFPHPEISKQKLFRKNLLLWRIPWMMKLTKRFNRGISWATLKYTKNLISLANKRFDNADCVMLYGDVSQLLIKGKYEVRSFMYLHAIFIPNEYKQDILKNLVLKETSEEFDPHFSQNVNRSYAGELYWADSILNYPLESDSYKDLEGHHPGFEYEPSTMDYMWEGQHSNLNPGISLNIPTKAFAKKFDLRIKPSTFEIIDQHGKSAVFLFEYKDDKIDQEFTYVNREMVSQYIKEKDYFMLYVVLQRSYDHELWGDQRKFTYYLPDL
ncbi:MAG: hypothetical protein DI539_16280 [Flavobacterium psychrophilum]|nr:MAG: hypothetical protein DI539_16280 [Flavobacterium psychrophilum]